MPDSTKTNYNQNFSNVNQDSGSILIPEIKLDKESERKMKRFLKYIKSKKFLKIVGAIAAVLVVFTLIATLMLFDMYKKTKSLENQARVLVAAVKTQDIDKINSELKNTKTELQKYKKSYRKYFALKAFPVAGKYINDADHGINAALHGIEAGEIVIDAIKPYADLIGLKAGSAQAASGNETAQDRIDFVVKTIPEIIPKADLLINKINLMEKELAYIDPDDYPEKIRGYEVRSKLHEGLDLFETNAQLAKKGKPLLEAIPDLIGANSEKTYLVLFQNDKELRPTGGFITAYSIAKVDKAKFEPVLSSDIYNLDNNYKPHIAAPDAFAKYLKGIYATNNRFRLRDMNWSPDFEESMKTFSKEAEGVGIKNINGIIAVDTQLLVYLLDVLGEVGVSGYGNFSTKIVPECNCPQVIYELESFADVEGPIVWSENEPGKIVFAPENYDNRKKIIGPLMNSILANTLGQPKEKMPLLFQAAVNSLLEKHVLFYLSDEKSQKAVEEFGIAGKIDEYDGDYIHINDSNLGGRKSNLYVTQEVNQEMKIGKEGYLEKTVTITYKNPEKYDGWLNSVLPNWVRIYVPKGSELLEINGVEDAQKPYEEFGKTVFAGFFQLRPQGVAKVSLKYRVPIKPKKDFKMLIQKQAGKHKIPYTFNIGKREEEYVISTDKELRFKI